MAGPIITLTTDFGTADPYAGIMKGVILSIAPQARLVDITHHLPPCSVEHGMIALMDSVDFFPPGSVHLAVVDPGVGGPRRALAVESGGRFFVGPDNGIFTPFFPAQKTVSLDRAEYRLDPVSTTFHGRDIFAPAAAHLVAGVDISKLGSPVADPLILDIPGPSKTGDGVRGRVIAVDRFGNLSTDIRAANLPPGRLAALIGGERIPVLSYYGEVAPGRPICLTGSSGRMEISIREGSAAEYFGAGENEPVEIRVVNDPD